ncbi:TIGR03773 family transporter-associated surface protein [Streptomyces sp. enrichment culture]|uniref:TIGR03773 family transporter-associated surface protein n=1 Tax=Streptomyces sp. enrichment culture TaxID=1795815 RepID=UPI003F55D8A2
MGTFKDRRWAAAALGSVVLAVGAAPAATADSVEAGADGPSAPGPAGVVVALEDDTLSLDLRQPGARDGADLEVGAESRTTVPGGGRYDFLGSPGSAVWLLGGTEAGAGAAAAVPEWDTTAVPAGSVQDGTVDWALTDVQGPGDVAVFEPSADAGPQVLFDSRDGVPDARTLAAGDTGAAVWAFTEPGEYRITSQASARLTSGTGTTATAEWTVTVAGEEARDTAAPGPTPAAPPSPGDTEPAGRPAAAAETTTTAAGSAGGTAETDVRTEKVVIDDGHVDAVAGKMVNGTLRTLFKDSRDPSGIVWREPSSVVMHVKPQAKQQVPTGGSYSFLGRAGTDFWLIPQVQQQGVVWAGWNTEDLTAKDLKGPVDLALTKVSGPGTLAVWETAGLGTPEVVYNSEDGLPDGQKVDLGVHAHANWAFSKEGTYKVTFRLRGTLASSGRTASDTRTYTFAVGDVDPGKVNPGGDGTDGGSTAAPGAGDGGATAGPDGAAPSAGVPAQGSAADGGGSLAHTGSEGTLPLALAAGTLVVAGAAVTVLGRRRRGAAETHAT